jgi:hypothetical protein
MAGHSVWLRQQIGHFWVKWLGATHTDHLTHCKRAIIYGLGGSDMAKNGRKQGELLRRYHWPKGKSGNPKGYSRKRREIDLLLVLIRKKNAQNDVTERWLQSILDGDFRYFKEFIDRKDGPIQNDTNVSGGTTIRIEYVDRPYPEFGSTAAEAADDHE